MTVSMSPGKIDAANAHAARIERVEIVPLRMPLKSAVKISDGGARDFVDTLLVRLHTDTGLSGVGETQAWRRQGASETHASLCSVIRDHFEPHLVGASPFSIASIMQRLEQSIYHSLYAQAAISDALVRSSRQAVGRARPSAARAANAATPWQHARFCSSSRPSPPPSTGPRNSTTVAFAALR